MRRWPFHIAALLVCIVAAVHGIRTTSDLEWPADVDQYRNVSFAQTIRDGHLLQDAFYLNEWTWYNPLMSTVVAGLSLATGIPVHRLETRAGAYLNLAAPVTFYSLLYLVFGLDVALVGLVVMVFASDSSWRTPTYSPWFFASNFTQPLFYVTVAACYHWLPEGQRRHYALAGLLLGLTFLAHVAPAAIAAALAVALVGHTWMTRPDAGHSLASRSLVGVAVAAVVSLPFVAAIGWHYGFRVKHPVPLVWSNLPTDDWRPLMNLIVSSTIVSVVSACGVVALALRRTHRRAFVVVMAWLVASGGLLAYTQLWLWWLIARGVGAPAIAPAHHFLMYLRAAGVMLFAVGAVELIRLIVRSERWRPWTAAAVAGAYAVTAYPAFAAREDFTTYRAVSQNETPLTELQALQPWLRAHTSVRDVFLTTQGAALTLVGPAGRRSVVSPMFFSNPYVDWEQRERDAEAMWQSLADGDCTRFSNLAAVYGVTFVLEIEGRTPILDVGRCGLTESGFPRTGFVRVFRWNPNAR